MTADRPLASSDDTLRRDEAEQDPSAQAGRSSLRPRPPRPERSKRGKKAGDEGAAPDAPAPAKQAGPGEAAAEPRVHDVPRMDPASKAPETEDQESVDPGAAVGSSDPDDPGPDPTLVPPTAASGENRPADAKPASEAQAAPESDAVGPVDDGAGAPDDLAEDAPGDLAADAPDDLAADTPDAASLEDADAAEVPPEADDGDPLEDRLRSITADMTEDASVHEVTEGFHDLKDNVAKMQILSELLSVRYNPFLDAEEGRIFDGDRNDLATLIPEFASVSKGAEGAGFASASAPSNEPAPPAASDAAPDRPAAPAAAPATAPSTTPAASESAPARPVAPPEPARRSLARRPEEDREAPTAGRDERRRSSPRAEVVDPEGGAVRAPREEGSDVPDADAEEGSRGTEGYHEPEEPLETHGGPAPEARQETEAPHDAPAPEAAPDVAQTHEAPATPTSEAPGRAPGGPVPRLAPRPLRPAAPAAPEAPEAMDPPMPPAPPIGMGGAPPVHRAREVHMVLRWMQAITEEVDPAAIYLFLDHYRRLGWISQETHFWFESMAEGFAERVPGARWSDTELPSRRLMELHMISLRFLDLFQRNNLQPADVGRIDAMLERLFEEARETKDRL